MCYCDTHFFTINRADEFMVGRRPRLDHELEMFETLPEPDFLYVIDPESMIQIIEEAIEMDYLIISRRDGKYVHVSVPDAD